MQIGSPWFGQGKDRMIQKTAKGIKKVPALGHLNALLSAGKGLSADGIRSAGEHGGKGIQVKAGDCAENLL